jgi:hypothetical protein
MKVDKILYSGTFFLLIGGEVDGRQGLKYWIRFPSTAVTKINGMTTSLFPGGFYYRYLTDEEAGSV